MAFIGFFVCAAGITTWIMLQNFDVRGFSLSERESMLSISGQSTSFLFEVKPGDYEFILHRYQFGEQVSEQAFLNGRGPMVEDDLFEGIRIYNRALMRAPAHMGQGSSVTYKSQSDSRQRPKTSQALFRASISACIRAFCLSSRRLRPTAMT